MNQLPTTAVQSEWTEDQVSLVKRTVFKGATDDELKLFMHICNRSGLDPFARQIYAMRRKNNKTGEYQMIVLTSIDGYRLSASRSGEYAGSDDPIFDSEPKPTKATITIYRIVKGVRCPFTATARWSEYYPGREVGFMWDKMPCTMLGKVAEALALRKGFPADLSGIYIKEEMDQAKLPSQGVFPEQPKAGDGIKGTETATTIPSGQFKQKSIYELSLAELCKLEENLMGKEDLSLEENQTLAQIQEYIVTLQNMPTGDAPITCDCGSPLKYSDKKNVYYCGNFKNTGTQHIRPIPKQEYEQMLKN